jgi:hypothetical protein
VLQDGLDSADLGWGPMAGSFECYSETSGSIENGGFSLSAERL